MKELKDTTALVVDNGLGFPIAQRLARDCGRVLYYTEWEDGFPTIQKTSVGAGFQDVERCYDIWEVKKEIDFAVFPDIGKSGLQNELASQGIPVWGARSADQFEMDREMFLDKLRDLGMQVPEYKLCIGIDALREYLKDNEDQYIKVPFFRGNFETKHFRSWRLDENLLDAWAVRFGALRNKIHFLVFKPIVTQLEIGGDTYNVSGEWPGLMLHGIEWKDKAYLSAVTKRNDMPEQVKEVLDLWGPVLGAHCTSTAWSMEIRVVDDDEYYFTDPTPRLGLPSTASQLEVWKNYSEIIYHGAMGHLIEPEPVGMFTGEILVTPESDDCVWPEVEVPEDLKQWLKAPYCCEVDGVMAFPKEREDDSVMCWLVAVSDDPKEVIKLLKERVEALPEGLSANVSALSDILKEIEEEEKQGITFTDKQMPEPSDVLT